MNRTFDEVEYLNRLSNIKKFFELKYKDVTNPNKHKDKISLYGDKLALHYILVYSDVNLDNNKIKISDETKYEVKERTLYVNSKDSLEQVDLKIMIAIIQEMYKNISIKDEKARWYGLFSLFYILDMIGKNSDYLVCEDSGDRALFLAQKLLSNM